MTDGPGPSFSVVIPTFERPEGLARCLAALSRSLMPPTRFEVIVVDDSGRTALDRIAANFGEIDLTLLKHAERGPGAARNAGAQAARGEFLAFTDDDCEPSPRWLIELERHLQEDPALVVGGRTDNALVADRFAEVSQLLVEFVSAHPDRTGARFFASNNLAMAKSTFDAVGGFDPGYRRAAGEDRDLCDRLQRGGHRMRYAPQALVAHHHALGLARFVRQQFAYGRGAHRFRSGRTRSSGGHIELEPTTFYAGLLAEPLRRAALHRAVPMMALVALSQVSVLAGFSWEAIAGEPDRRKSRTASSRK